MAYKESDVEEQNRFMESICVANGEDVDLDEIKNTLLKLTEDCGIEVSVSKDVLKTGTLFSRRVEDILVVINPEHAVDYLWLLIRVTYKRKRAFLNVYKFGESENYLNDNRAKKSISQGIFNMFSKHDQKLQEEERYYSILADCIYRLVEE